MKNITLFIFVTIFLFACTHTGKHNNGIILQEDNGSTDLIESEESDSDISNYVSDFKFPTEKIADKDENMYEALSFLYEYFSDSLKWIRSKEFLQYGNHGEEEFWRQGSIRLSINKLTFDDGIRLFYHIYLTDKDVEIKHNKMVNDDVKIWYAVFKTKEKFQKAGEKPIITFCRVIEKNNYIQLIVDFGYWRDYDEITNYLNKIIKNRNYNDRIWKEEISLEEQYLIIEENL